ncbi:hypothetical protein BpHYR1_042948 [Brachionus plicatilis]|uniref:Uncharacterized protein n=1 Tax=Brachionus plicatilis TaxID=10195 RepID=A0A3M7SMK2_BRAPC|nr:hypothetical protein BpHYR1_042948 [Brachionus plicatilis]
MLLKANSTTNIKKNSNRPKMKKSISENELDVKSVPLMNDLVFKISSLKPEKNNISLGKERSKTIIDLNDFNLNNMEEYDLINAKVNNVKMAVSQYITQLEQRGPKLEELEASCLKLSQHTKDLEQVAVQTKKFYYNNYFYQKYNVTNIFMLKKQAVLI